MMDDLVSEPPTEINPYDILQIEITATSNDVKTAYKKLALRHHPDKAHPTARDAAHVQFQEIAFAYAILSDERRRRRYDTTGNTSESLELEDDDFNWSDFFRAQWADAVTGDKLNSFKDTYQNSEEERKDVLSAYKSAKGNLDKVFKQVMLSNPLDDEDRFRALINDAIKTGEVEEYDAYANEPTKKKAKRREVATREGVEAEEHAKELGLHHKLFGSKKSESTKNGKKDDETGLAELIQQRQKGRAATFLDDLEAKYGGGKDSKSQKGKGSKRKVEEPPEELFQRNRQKKQKVPEAEVEDDEEENGGSVDLDDESSTPDREEQKKMKQAKAKRKVPTGSKGRKKGTTARR